MGRHRHKRETNARHLPRASTLAGSLALLATASVVSIGVAQADPVGAILMADDPADTGASTVRSVAAPVAPTGTASPMAADRGLAPVSREAVRGATIQEQPSELELVMAPAAVAKAVDGASEDLYATTELNLWTGPAEGSANVGELAEGDEVLVTGRTLMGREEVVVDGAARWVTQGYLDPDEPTVVTEADGTTTSVPASGGVCTNGSTVSAGVSPNIVKVHDAVCAAFPSISTYGDFRGDGEHAQGIAVDIMVSGSTGYAVADFVRAHAGELGVSYVIYSQRIWSVERGGEGWRGMEDRGSVTANHYDHVHVTTY